ncbi:MAG: hypothetical protein ABUK01_11705 [Leptospirales bacterium]
MAWGLVFTSNREEVGYEKPGSDQIWYTADDEPHYYTLYSYRQKSLHLQITYTEPGSDNKWFTEDDEIAEYIKRKFNYDGALLKEESFNGPGPDQTWFTYDDVMDWFIHYELQVFPR